MGVSSVKRCQGKQTQSSLKAQNQMGSKSRSVIVAQQGIKGAAVNGLVLCCQREYVQLLKRPNLMILRPTFNFEATLKHGYVYIIDPKWCLISYQIYVSIILFSIIVFWLLWLLSCIMPLGDLHGKENLKNVLPNLWWNIEEPWPGPMVVRSWVTGWTTSKLFLFTKCHIRTW